ncbi:nucleotidyltransferase domain-containing protein [Candidatus Woesearchaeota archaeon]|nr:nucleotidyltransferase domain-containing protein [Candidatus Woesearchaeota archaeon]
MRSVAQRIGGELPVKKVILFGSYAWGKPGPDSDVDLFIIMKSRERPARRASRIYQMLYPPPFPMDILVRTPQEVRRRMAQGDFFISDIIKQGKVLYERQTY